MIIVFVYIRFAGIGAFMEDDEEEEKA
jgi:hypothetical protein